EPTYSVVCSNGHICPFYTMNPFVIFQMTPTLNIDRALLDQRYFAFQRMLHPDKLQHASVQIQQWAEQHISQVNQAYKALQDTLSVAKATALYLQDPTLGLEQFDDEDIPMLDSDFLSNIIRLQTQGVPEDIVQLNHQIIVDLDQSIRELNLTHVLSSIARLTYVERLRKLIQEI
ncbi:MAG: hypothetical protein Q8Q56_05460, partial [Alphaproteobacteria bacterium]|nr:hypothetical protein [Alphaproteobacteria bacterium]